VKGRRALGILLGLLLPVPLVLVLVLTTNGKASSGDSPDQGVSPVLSFEERQQRVTYERRCERREDCEPPLGCLFDQSILASYCTDSQCLTDAQCPEGFTCQTLSTLGEGPRVRHCLATGARREGEGCRSPPKDQQEACAPGLICGSGWCGRPCRLDEPTSCPEGFSCAEANPGLACQPTCDGRGCPDGQQCIRWGKASTCAVVHGTHCQQSPCAPGQQCTVRAVPRRPGEVWSECAASCDEARALCPAGRICLLGRCREPCEPANPGACGTGFRCGRHGNSQPWTCQPDV